MPEHSLHHTLTMAIAFAICTPLSSANAEVYKCKDADGKTIYGDTPCAAAGKPMRLPDPGKASTTDPQMCAQLLDELNRLAAEVDRNTQKGRTESAASTKRRQGLTRQYEARCVGIARSEPKPK
jgi:hypothetical protein